MTSKVKRTGIIDLSVYDTKERRKKYKKCPTMPIPADIRWKALILTMRGGEWMNIGYIQEITTFSRKRVRLLLQKGMQAGIIEKSFEEFWQQPPKRKAYWSKGNGWLYRRVAYYKMDMSKIDIIVK